MVTVLQMQNVLADFLGVSIDSARQIGLKLNPEACDEASSPECTPEAAVAQALCMVIDMPHDRIQDDMSIVLGLPLDTGRMMDGPRILWRGSNGRTTVAGLYNDGLPVARTFGGVMAQMVDGRFQQSLGFQPNAAINVDISSDGPTAKIFIRDSEISLSVEFAPPGFKQDFDREAPLSTRMTLIDDRVIFGLTDILYDVKVQPDPEPDTSLDH